MAQYFTDDFADFGTDWTSRYATPTINNFAVTGGDMTYPGFGGYGSDWVGKTWNDIDGDADRDDVEILVQFQMQSGASDGAVVMFRGSGADESATLYAIIVASIRMRSWVCNGADTPTVVQSVTKTLTNGTTYWLRARGNGTSIQARIWSGAIGDEPGTWDLNTTNSVISAAGWVGAAAYNSASNHTLYQIGVGTNGDSAPSAAVGGGVPTLSASTYVPGSLTSTGWRPQVTATY